MEVICDYEEAIKERKRLEKEIFKEFNYSE